MPKGFLVKRNKRPTPVSYRVRCSEEDERDEARLLLLITSSYYQQRPAPPTSSLLLLNNGGAAPPLPSSASPERATAAAAPCPASGARLQQQEMAPERQRPPPLLQFGHPECGYHPSALYSPSRPVSHEHQPTESRGFGPGSSPICAESFPGPAPAAATTKKPPQPEAKPPPQHKQPKKTKAIRKLAFEDEVTTSPVLGLRIKEGPLEPPRARPPGAAARPLGEFICQLCREEYADPLALAQHRCSRIVRVEYRCPECDKVFSCPANLASHRRWHKPRPPPQLPTTVSGEVKSEVGEARTDTPSPGPSESGSEEGLYECPHCSKRFRRQAYLRKHLLAHRAPPSPTAGEEVLLCGPLDMSSSAPVSEPRRPYPCPVCGEAFSCQGGQERHLRLLHAAQLFPCKYCPATFYSSPGLTRHINKCHPSENRQVILLQVPVRPAC